MPEPACPNDCCRHNPTDLDDLLGHDHLGHFVRNLLCRSGIRDQAALAGLSDEQLLSIRQFGRDCLARVRGRFPAPVKAGSS